MNDTEKTEAIREALDRMYWGTLGDWRDYDKKACMDLAREALNAG